MGIKRIMFGFKSIALATLLVASQSSHALVIGNDTVNRGSADTWSNFVLGLQSETFGTAGTVTDWSVYTQNAGTLGMLILRNTGGTSYDVVGADFETTTSGLNTFSFAPDTGTADVMAGDILGLFIGTSKVDFDYNGADTVNWCGSSGCISNSTTQLAAGQTLNLSGGPQGRVYSAKVSMVPVPEPATLTLLALGLAGVAFRRKTV